jgi:hypothetical protein
MVNAAAPASIYDGPMRVRPIAWLASLSISGAACGGGDGNPDAPPGGSPDAPPAIDARVDAVPVGAITVRVLGDYGQVDDTDAPVAVGVPCPGTSVYFLRPDGDAQLVPADANGLAVSADVPPGTTALVVRAQAEGAYALTAFTALAPGAMVTAGPDAPLALGAFAATPMTVTAPPYGTPVRYTLSAGCGAAVIGGPAYSLYLREGCEWTDRTVVAQAIDFGTGALLGYTSGVIDYTAGGAATLPAFTAPATFSGEITGVPAGSLQTVVYGRYRDTEGAWLSQFYLNGGGGVPTLSLEADVAPVGASLALAVNVISSRGKTLFNGLGRVATGAPTAATFDLAGMLPFITIPTWSGANATASWLEYAPLRTADLALVSVGYFVGGIAIPVTVRVFGPHAGTAVTLPALPAELSHLAPTASTEVTVLEAYLVDEPAAPGYAEVVGAADAKSRALAVGMFGETDAWVSGAPTVPEDPDLSPAP